MSGQSDAASQASERVLRLEPDSYPAFEAVVNAYLRHGELSGVAALLRAFWRRYPQKWDAALIGVLSALRTGQSSEADSLLGEMRDHLVERGVDSAAEWPGSWRADHPALVFFSDAAHWSDQPTGDPAESSDPDVYGPKRQENARKLGAICEAISTQVPQVPSHREVGRQGR